jgi:hypothetical protein
MGEPGRRRGTREQIRLERAELQQMEDLLSSTAADREQQRSTASTFVPGLLSAGLQEIDLRHLHYYPFSNPDAEGDEFSFQQRENHNLSSSEDRDFEDNDPEDAMVIEFDVDAAQRAIQLRLQQNREHLLPRYYKLVGDITPDLWRWSIVLYESAMDNSKHILSEESLKRMPTPQVFRDIGSNLLSKDSERVLAAASIFAGFVRMWGEFCSGESLRDIMQDVSEITNMKEFFELLQEDGMEEEKLAWYWCLLYRTGCDVDSGT